MDKKEKCAQCEHNKRPAVKLPEKIPTEGKDPQSRAAGYAYGWNDAIEEMKKGGLYEVSV